MRLETANVRSFKLEVMPAATEDGSLQWRRHAADHPESRGRPGRRHLDLRQLRPGLRRPPPTARDPGGADTRTMGPRLKCFAERVRTCIGSIARG